ncbi:MAG TPA: hypothetical protein VFZ09_42745 [Archangium sp.]|nr:hypothetical protein [Archangium sp.]HEX5752997.1 hypothetical protein [Archangium sp.]
MTKSTETAQALTIALDEKASTLNISWENTQVSVPLRLAGKG